MQGRALRRELADGGVVIRAAVDSRSVKISGGIGNHPVVSKACVGNAGKTVNDFLRPVPECVGFELENGATTAARSALARGSVESALLAENQVADGSHSVSAAFETVEHSFGPRAIGLRRELINGAEVIGTVVIRSAVEIACRVEG